ncbi:MAG: hypothetical protein ABS78_06720 [Phenylobacterium sp. SCN 70-31]|nr:MAG: hypothetical protein ABS78_06720 [Phenylobacterium sp. SCN 70-31]
MLETEPHGPAVQYEGSWWTWDDMRRIGDRMRAILDAADVGASEGVGLVLRQRPHSFGAYLGVLGGRRCAVMITPIQPDLAICADVRALRLRAVVADRQDWRRDGFREAVAAAGSIGIELTGDRTDPVRVVEGLETVGPEAHYPPAPNVGAAVLTSGTTGPPKRIAVSFDEFRGEFPENLWQRTRRGVAITAVPLVSIGGATSMVQSVWRGRAIALMERFDIWKWAELVLEHKPRHLGAPPAALRMLLDAKVPPEYLASGELFIAGSAPVDLATSDEFERVYGVLVVRRYGATEFLGNAMGFDLDALHLVKEKRGSVGTPRPGIKARIIDPASGDELPAGEIGVLQIDTPRRSADAPPGWITTNDLARRDEDGFYWIEGRADDVLIRGGFKVSADDVGAVLRDHPAVADAAVVGIPDPRLTQVPIAAVVLKPAQATSAQELMDWVRARKPAYYVPTKVVFVDEIPRNAMLKVVPGRVRDLVNALEAAEIPVGAPTS